MKPQRHPATFVLPVVVLMLASCNGDGASTTSTSQPVATSSTTSTTEAADTTTSTTTTTVPEETSTSTTTTIVAGISLLAAEGDRNEIVEAVQFLLNCGGADLAVDGAFGPGTRAAVEAAQARLGVTADGVAGDQTIASLSRACSEIRRLDAEGEVTVIGNAAPGDSEIYALTLLVGSTLSAAISDGTGLGISLTDAEGVEIEPASAGSWAIDTSQEYRLEIVSPSGAMNFALVIDVAVPAPEVGEWILATDGITYGDTELGIGDDAGTVIDHVFDFLGHGIRGAYDEFDTGWYAIDEPLPVGLRGVFIEGLAFLFFGPHPGEPDLPETLQRIRFEGPSDDADGRPRPDHYVTTAEGITVGDTLAELKAAYGDRVGAGSNDDEFYYRFADSGGELCFYFETDEEPEELSEISEIATECRTG